MPDVMQRARLAGVQRFYLPAIDSETIEDVLSLEKLYPQECFAMAGLHPCSVKENFADELKLVEENLASRRFAAIGEIGLDFYWDKTYTSEQYQAFNMQMEWALQYALPVVIHTRNAMQETIDAVKPFAARGLRGIFHCFGDSYEMAAQIISMGFLLGIGGVMTYKNAGMAGVLEKIDVKHLVLETDAPYLTPVPFRGKRNESSYLKYIAEKLSEIKKMDIEEVAAITTANAEKIFVH